jgi:nitrite reductase/ring-hydroxylating ferredoxin subunit
MATRHVVAKVDELPVGGKKLVSVKGREIGVFNVNGEFYALLNKCPHAGASLCLGRIIGLAQADEPGQYRLTRKGELLRCPWHGWEFDIRTGQSWCDPQSTFVRSFEVKVEPGEQLVKGPYVAETFPVSVQDNYLVIEL